MNDAFDAETLRLLDQTKEVRIETRRDGDSPEHRTIIWVVVVIRGWISAARCCLNSVAFWIPKKKKSSSCFFMPILEQNEGRKDTELKMTHRMSPWMLSRLRPTVAAAFVAAWSEGSLGWEGGSIEDHFS